MWTFLPLSLSQYTLSKKIGLATLQLRQNHGLHKILNAAVWQMMSFQFTIITILSFLLPTLPGSCFLVPWAQPFFISCWVSFCWYSIISYVYLKFHMNIYFQFFWSFFIKVIVSLMPSWSHIIFFKLLFHLAWVLLQPFTLDLPDLIIVSLCESHVLFTMVCLIAHWTCDCQPVPSPNELGACVTNIWVQLKPHITPTHRQ